MTWLIQWLLVQTVFRAIAWAMLAAYGFVTPWIASGEALLSPYFTPWFDPAWREALVLRADYRVWVAIVVAAFAADGVILLARRRASRRARLSVP